MSCPARVYPLKRPEGHQPPVPRWQLKYDDALSHVHVLYVGAQLRGTADAEKQSFKKSVELIGQATVGHAGGSCSETFVLIDGNDAADAHVRVCYWTDEKNYEEAVKRLSLKTIHAELPQGRDAVGLWVESFSIPISRAETNYSGLDYLPGLARLPRTTTEPHTLTAYWGAARDRIPESAYDLFEEHAGPGAPKNLPAGGGGLGQHLVGTNAENFVHIRSGQFWENCDESERQAYEKKLEPTLEAGLRYLWEHPDDTGAMGLRYLRNCDSDDDGGGISGGGGSNNKRRETCVTGFFSSLGKLEGWAKQHRSHLAIYNGAMRHAKTFGNARRFRTWHEVCVLKRGEARFEYLNCAAGTGVMQFVALREEGEP